jgi:TonB family protein
MRPRPGLAAALTIAAMLASAPPLQAQTTTLAAARDLYASAAYEDALNALNDLASKPDAGVDASTALLYRALCLYALGRNADADHQIENLVAANPLYRPPVDELSPRIRTTVSDTRRRVLPGVLQQKYADAKSAYDRKDYATAASSFSIVLDGLSDPDIATAAGQSPLADLRTLASGFRDLSNKALAPPPAPVAAAVKAAPATVTPPPPPRIYTADDADVVAPVAVRQPIPPYTRPVIQRKTAVVQLLISETGAVESASMLSSLDAQYDRAVLAAAKGWQYQPAKAGGKPVKFQKRVPITLVPK